MTAVFLLGILAGLVLLMTAWATEHAADADAFTALDRLGVAGPLGMRPLFAVAAAVSASAALAGLPAVSPVERATAALALVITVWVVWLAAWVDLRWLLDAAIVFQDHVPLDERPPEAFSHAPNAALSFRPVSAALVLLAALAVTGAGFGVLGRYFGWTRLLPLLAGAVWLAIGLTFGAYMRVALGAERRVRSVLGHFASASDADLFDALRRNPRSARLLLEHARRLEDAAEPLQALLEYRAAELSGSFPDAAGEGAARARSRLAHPPGPIVGSILRKRREPEPRMDVSPLQPPPDAIPLRVIDPARFLGELLALTDGGLILNIQGEVDPRVAQQLRGFEHLAPLVPDHPARPQAHSVSWRLEPEVREAVRGAIAAGALPAGWVNLHLYALDRMLVQARSHFSLVLVAPELMQREFTEWRRAAAVAPIDEASAGSAT